MARSYSKYVNAYGRNFSRDSEKQDKKQWHRKFRRKFNALCHKGEEAPYVHIYEVSNKYWMSKDGGPYRIKREDLKMAVEKDLEEDMNYNWFCEETKKKVYSLKYRSSR